MANFYWVGGTGDWSGFGTHWATTSGGGTFHANAPTSDDDVFIDSSSGFGSGGTITLDSAEQLMKDFTSSSGHTFTIGSGSNSFSVYGSITLESGLTLQPNNVSFYGTATHTITSNGAYLNAGANSYVSFYGSGTYTLQDDLTTNSEIWIANGTFDANDHNVTCHDVYIGFLTDNPTVVMSSGTWTLTKSDNDIDPPWTVDETTGPCTVTITPETSTIKLTDTSVSNKTFNGGGKTYNNLWLAGDGTGTFIITGSNTFNDFKIDAGNTVKFTQSTTTTVSTFTATGTAGNLITLDSVDGATQFTLSDASGTNTCDYLNLSNSNAAGGATWYAGSHSNDTINNDGWIFTDEPSAVTQVAIGNKKFRHLKLDKI